MQKLIDNEDVYGKIRFCIHVEGDMYTKSRYRIHIGTADDDVLKGERKLSATDRRRIIAP